MSGEDWKDALDELTAQAKGKVVTIEVLDREFGDQHEVERLPFVYATYDPKDDVTIIAVGGTARYPVVLRHMVWRPDEIDVADGPVLRVLEPDGTTTLATFYDAG
ncbi:DUF5335 family protein [Lentzea sp. NPDC005914]|uniref:DUF5335 family protein n=1 Tax=Lentzea sp. NPDC005914 TaxID=3154572 RepID=UPI0033D2A7F3